MNKTVKYTLWAFVVIFIACGIAAVLLFAPVFGGAPTAYAENEQTASAEDFTSADLSTNEWAVEPTINSYVPNRGDPPAIQGSAAFGTVKFSVYKVENGVESAEPVNETLTDFTLTNNDMSGTVRDALKALPVLVSNETRDDHYILRATAEAEGYEPLTKDVPFKVLYQNKWAAGGTPKLYGWVWGDTPGKLTEKPVPLMGAVSYKIEGFGIPAGGETFDSMEAFNERLAGGADGSKPLGHKDEAKDYTVTYFVPQTYNYSSYTFEQTIRVKKKIVLPTDYDGAAFNIPSFYCGTILDGADRILWNIPDMCAEATTVNFAVISSGGQTVLQQDVMLRSNDRSHVANQRAFMSRLLLLDAGEYNVRATVFEGDTYGSASSEHSLTVSKAPLPDQFSNRPVWTVEPSFDITDSETGEAVWQFGKKAAVPIATPSEFADHKLNDAGTGLVANNIDLTSEILITYYKRVQDADGNYGKGDMLGSDLALATINMPTDVGKYYAEFTVREGAKYYMPEDGVRLVPFEITMADDWTFTTNPYAVGWTWGEFNKNVNLFGAIPTRGGAVDFTVMKGDEPVAGLEHFTVDAQNIIVDGDGKLGEKLNALDSGNYILKVNVASSGNYTPFTGTAAFRVAPAANSWKVSPNIARWAQYYFDPAKNEPQGSATFGILVMEVRGKDDGKLYYKSENGAVSCNELDTALAGWYTFSATVAESTNFSGLNYNIEFQVFSESADMPTNYWVIVPRIDSWIAGGVKSVPEYDALRGTEIITYSRVELKDGKFVPVGDIMTELPDLPGKYIMYARVENPLLPQDELLKHDVLFDIFERINEWTVAPSIQSYTLIEGPSIPTADILYKDDCTIEFTYRLKSGGEESATLPTMPGTYIMTATATAKYCAVLTAEVEFTVSLSKNEWTVAPSIQNYSLGVGPSTPIADVLYKDGYMITYTYRPKSGGEESTFLPTTPGTYIMTATATADKCEPLTAEVEFIVSLSKNSWVSAPTIKDWSEEETASNPLGEAAVGSDRIVYSYARADKPDEKFSERPTEEGNYILYATLDMEGYEKLTAEWEFTVISAYDRTLVTFNIILGATCCALATVVIIFAVRRYKQNS